MAKNKITTNRLLKLVIKHKDQVTIEQTCCDLEGKTENQIERIEQKAINKQIEIADKIIDLEMSQREQKEHAKADLTGEIKFYLFNK